MAEITYPWNPFQDQIKCDIVGEVIKSGSANGRMEFVPRAAPFFTAAAPNTAKQFQLFKKGSTTPMVFGEDYVFAHPFDLFIDTYRRNVFGSVVLLKPVSEDLIVNYSTIGGPFILNEVAFLDLVANIINSPRIVDWSKLSNVPTEFPPDPHDHPMVQTYDYYEFMSYIRSLIRAIGYTDDNVTVLSLLEDHIKQRLNKAHTANGADLGLSDVQNMGPATVQDLNGNSDNKVLTVATLKEAFRMFQSGQLNLD